MKLKVFSQPSTWNRIFSHDHCYKHYSPVYDVHSTFDMNLTHSDNMNVYCSPNRLFSIPLLSLTALFSIYLSHVSYNIVIVVCVGWVITFRKCFYFHILFLVVSVYNIRYFTGDCTLESEWSELLCKENDLGDVRITSGKSRNVEDITTHW